MNQFYLAVLVCAAATRSLASTVSATSLEAASITSPNSSPVIFESNVQLSTDARVTLSGSSGNLISLSSVNASAFFGDGNRLILRTALNSTQTFTGANTFLSSFTTQTNGRSVWLSTTSAHANIMLTENGITTFNPEIHNSTWVLVPHYETSNQDLSICVPGSTISITSGGGAIEIGFSGRVSVGGAYGVGLGLLHNGQFVNGTNSTKGVTESQICPPCAGSFRYLVSPAPLPGVQTFCISLYAFQTQPVYSAILLSTDSASGVSVRNIFYASELR